MIYTIVPIDMLLNSNDKVKKYEELTIKGIPCYVEQVNDLEYKIIRIHTSDPNIYMKNEFQPGTIINLKDKL